MGTFKASVSGNNINVTVEDHSDEVLELFRAAIDRGLAACGETAVSYGVINLKQQGAWDTGRLANSLAYAVKGVTDQKTIKYTEEDAKSGAKGKEVQATTDEEDVCYIGTAVYYGPMIECGTGQYASTGGGTPKPSWVYQDEFGDWHRAYPQKPRPYLKPAVADHAQEFWELLKDSLENA